MTSCQGCAVLPMVWVCGSQRIKSWGSLRHDPNVQFDRTVLSTCDSSRPFHHHPCLEKEKYMVSGCLTTVNQCKLPLYNNIPAFGVGSKSGTILSAESWQSTNQLQFGHLKFYIQTPPVVTADILWIAVVLDQKKSSCPDRASISGSGDSLLGTNEVQISQNPAIKGDHYVGMWP
jgi:hypothetical protein